MSKKQPHLLFIVTEDWYFCSHRLPLAIAARDAGYRVGVATRVRSHGHMIQDAGLDLFPVEIKRSGLNPLSDLVTFLQYIKVCRRFKPDLIHNVALKPVLYGSLAAVMAANSAVVNALAGLGYVFTSKTLRATILRQFIKPAFRLLLAGKKRWVVLQNPDDMAVLTENGMCNHRRAVLIPGAGVNVAEFVPTEAFTRDMLLVVLPARMLRDKGVVEFVDAARRLLSQGMRARFALVGDVDPQNPGSLNSRDLEQWSRDGIIEWWGWQDDMRHVLAQTDIVCLPSYREGMPKALLEAAACGLPIVTCDVPGCREVVLNNINGLLVPARDAVALATALGRLLDNTELRRRMGAAGRKRAEEEFALDRIIGATMALYQHATAECQARL